MATYTTTINLFDTTTEIIDKETLIWMTAGNCTYMQTSATETTLSFTFSDSTFYLFRADNGLTTTSTEDERSFTVTSQVEFTQAQKDALLVFISTFGTVAFG